VTLGRSEHESHADREGTIAIRGRVTSIRPGRPSVRLVVAIVAIAVMSCASTSKEDRRATTSTTRESTSGVHGTVMRYRHPLIVGSDSDAYADRRESTTCSKDSGDLETPQPVVMLRRRARMS
jgi:hypothetical protein